MKQKEFTEDQIRMMSDAILSHIHSIRTAGNMSGNKSVSDVCVVEIGKLCTLLDYINA